MDVLKRLEQKIQALVTQRNQLREELERVRSEHGGHETELQQLRLRVENLQTENVSLAKERSDAAKQLESNVKRLEVLLKQLDQQEQPDGDQCDLFKHGK
jgi:chromosome segregation ATPase